MLAAHCSWLSAVYQANLLSAMRLMHMLHCVVLHLLHMALDTIRATMVATMLGPRIVVVDEYDAA